MGVFQSYGFRFLHVTKYHLSLSLSPLSHRYRQLVMSPNSSAVSGGDAAKPAGEFMLFGVRVIVDSMRKSVSMNNLSEYELPNESAKDNKEKEDLPAGYASADDAVNNNGNNSGGSRERKRGVPWTEEEHKLFLLGLQKVGKGDWRGISRNFVKTRTPTQVASHAQKYYLRRSNQNRRRRRSSLFDITTDSVTTIPMDQDKVNVEDNASLSPTPSEPRSAGGFAAGTPFSGTMRPVSFPAPTGNPRGNQNLITDQSANSAMVKPKPIHVLPIANASSSSDLNLNLKSPAVDPSPPLSLSLSLSSNQIDASSRHFQAMSRFNNGVISVS